MWLFTGDGFYSAVVDQSDRNEIVVRARAKDSLENLISKLQYVWTNEDDETIICTPDRDYPYRIFISRNTWANYLVDYVTDLEYTDFKSYCRKFGAHSTEKRLHALSEVWGIMYEDYADRPTRSEIGPIELSGSENVWRQIRKFK
jgi:hypothetical protein|tara:strand:+ start:81 stop:515 length:435 start_codon:yes stop_codon:yes gene_type:complete